MKEDKYKNNFLDCASKLDALINGQGEIVKCALAVAESEDHDKTVKLLKQMVSIVDSDKYPEEVKRVAKILNSTLIQYLGHTKLVDICGQEKVDEDTRTLPQLLEELNNLVGLESVKAKVSDLIAYQKVQKLREKQGLYSQKGTMHLAFTGKPGTGKTTVARIVGYIYKQLGLLSKGHFVEVSRTDLIAGYQGQTALKVKKVIERAKGGVLFIDEAYSITENDHTDSYGRECLTELTKALEDYRDDLVVIVAGYTEPMKHFFASNPGLKSRFNTFIEFPDYDAKELEEILVKMCSNNAYKLSEEALSNIRVAFQEQVESKDENFANGRLSRNLFDDLIMNHAKRVAEIENPDRETLSRITAGDFKGILKGN